jgi:hypothetical protein
MSASSPSDGTTDRRETVDVIRRNWRAEVETAQVYRDFGPSASRMKNAKEFYCAWPRRKSGTRRAGSKNCATWENRSRNEDTVWTRLKRRFTRSLGTDIAIRRMEVAEEKHEREFSAQRDEALKNEDDVREFLRTSALEEKAHARALNVMAGPPNPQSALDTILKRERWHGRGGSWVADAIYGVNDGLGAVFGIFPVWPEPQTINSTSFSFPVSRAWLLPLCRWGPALISQ